MASAEGDWAQVLVSYDLLLQQLSGSTQRAQHAQHELGSPSTPPRNGGARQAWHAGAAGPPGFSGRTGELAHCSIIIDKAGGPIRTSALSLR